MNLNQSDVEAMQQQQTLTAEQQAVFFGQVIKALLDILQVKKQKKPARMLIHPRLYDQLFPAEIRFSDVPKECFSIPVRPEVGVSYGQFVFETRERGIIRGH